MPICRSSSGNKLDRAAILWSWVVGRTITSAPEKASSHDLVLNIVAKSYQEEADGTTLSASLLKSWLLERGDKEASLPTCQPSASFLNLMARIQLCVYLVNAALYATGDPYPKVRILSLLPSCKVFFSVFKCSGTSDDGAHCCRGSS